MTRDISSKEGGYDSSYNGVAIAVGYRLLLFHPDNKNLSKALEKAVYWLDSRVSNSGEVCLEGNSRVFVGGESFLGKEKGVVAEEVVFFEPLQERLHLRFRRLLAGLAEYANAVQHDADLRGLA